MPLLPELRTLLFFVLISALHAESLSQNICGVYGLPYYADDIMTQLTLKEDSTFDYIHHSAAYHNQKESGRWSKAGNILILAGCASCDVAEPLIIQGVVRKKHIAGPFRFKYITIREDSLFIVRPVNMIDDKPSLIKKK